MGRTGPRIGNPLEEFLLVPLLLPRGDRIGLTALELARTLLFTIRLGLGQAGKLIGRLLGELSGGLLSSLDVFTRGLLYYISPEFRVFV